MHQQRPLLGIFLMLAAMVLVPILDIFAKLLSEEYSVIQVTWARFLFHTLWLDYFAVCSWGGAGGNCPRSLGSNLCAVWR